MNTGGIHNDLENTNEKTRIKKETNPSREEFIFPCKAQEIF